MVKPSSVNVKVVVRCRPLFKKEMESGDQSVVEVLSENTIQAQDKTFHYDRVFPPQSTQDEIFTTVDQLVMDAIDGFNCTIFAYGQTGTGKTFTMQGPDEILHDFEQFSTEDAGIIPRAVQLVFDRLRTDYHDFTVNCSHLELYNEELIDLLGDGKTNLRILEDKKGVRVDGQEERHVRGPLEVLKLLQQGYRIRKTACTNLNDRSSRSHYILTMNIHTRVEKPEGDDILKLGKLNLVDLAGSENVGRSGVQGVNLKEAGMINQSLLTLSRVMIALLKKGASHVPYRESKLTRILQESLGGKTKTVLIATITPGLRSIEDTLSTLRYAKMAKQIENRPEVNQRAQRQLLGEKIAEIEKLKKQIIHESHQYVSNQASNYQQSLTELSSLVNHTITESSSQHEDNVESLNQLESFALCLVDKIRKQKEESERRQELLLNSLQQLTTKIELSEAQQNQETQSFLNFDHLTLKKGNSKGKR
ncbi:hypothetical protein P9112_009796 [Eukaryota sp. TZLM1-RC]